MPHCENYQMLISALLDDEITENQRADLMEHLETCADCAAFLSDQLALKDSLRGLTAQAPEDFSESIMARVRETAQDRPENEKKVLAFPGLRRWVGLAACCAVVAIGALALGGLPHSMSATADSAACETAVFNENGSVPMSDYGRSTSDSMTYGSDFATDSVTESDDCDAFLLSAENYASLLVTDSDIAARFVADTLKQEWVSGAQYELTADEYALLHAMLIDNEASFTEETGDGSCEVYLLRAE